MRHTVHLPKVVDQQFLKHIRYIIIFPSFFLSNGLVNHHRLVGGHKVLDVDERILASVHFQLFQRLNDQLAKIDPLSLAVVKFVSQVVVFIDKHVQHRQDLTVVRHQRLADQSCPAGDRHVAVHQRLQDLEHLDDHVLLAGVEGRLDRDDELGNHGEHLVGTRFQHIHDTLLRHKGIRQFLLSQTVKEDWQIMVEVELLDFYLPRQSVRHSSVIYLDRKIATFVESDGTEKKAGC